MAARFRSSAFWQSRKNRQKATPQGANGTSF